MYAMSLWLGGLLLFIALVRLFSSDWQEVGRTFAGVLKPRWVSALQQELNETDPMRFKIVISAILAVYLTVVFHLKLGDRWAAVLLEWGLF